MQPTRLQGPHRRAPRRSASILGDLNRLTAREIVAEKADATRISPAYNLAKPPVRVRRHPARRTASRQRRPSTSAERRPARASTSSISGKDAVYLVGPEALVPLPQGAAGHGGLRVRRRSKVASLITITGLEAAC